MIIISSTFNSQQMKKFILALLTAFLFCLSAFSQIVLQEPLSERQTYYKINAKLNTIAKIVEGEMETYWVNKSTDHVTDVQMHLYLNAFRNFKTTFNKESGQVSAKKRNDSGWIDIKKITDRNGHDLITALRFISPDGGNINDSTVVSINLPESANPGDTVFLKIQFESKLPSRIIRTGYKDDFYFVGQWFPKFGVYESVGMRYAVKGSWNCHQFHKNSEFYSDPGVYDVMITLPQNYIVGSCGMLTGESDIGNGEKTMTFRAEDIIDFAWTAWPSFAIFTDQWKNVKITLLLPPERKIQAERQFTAVKNALEYFEKHVGPYPWPYLTFVDPPSKGAGSGGMEYTTLFTSESFTGIPGFLHFPEMVTIHEFGHAYFMGILESNEFEEAWLDEGVNQFMEGRIMDHYYGINSSLIDNPLLEISDKSMARLAYVNSGSRQVISNREFSWNYPHGTYGMMSYHKTAVCLGTMMGILGEETTDEIFREYYRKWAFKHPSGSDFINVVNEVVRKSYGDRFGPDMNWFFDQTIYGTGICDYKVSDISNISKMSGRPSYDKADTLKTYVKGLAENDSFYDAVVELERDGEVMLPVDVLVHFRNGEEILETWDGKGRYKDFRYTGRGEVLWVKIDPENKILMDVNLINNSITLEPDRVPVRRLAGKLTTLLQFFISTITL
jgi:hypothetical protein